MISSYETIPVKTQCEETPDGPGGGWEYRPTGGVGISLGPLGRSLETAGVNPLRSLAKLGRWCLDQTTAITTFSSNNCNVVEAKAVQFGLGYMEDMGTYEVFIESDSAKVLEE